MSKVFIHKKSETPDEVPAVGDLDRGELGINLPDRIIYTKDQTDSIVNLTDCQTLPEIDEVVNANTVRSVFIYDTSLDDDAGQWVDEATTQSWYHETLDTISRGATRPFPKLALVVVEDDSVTIYDAGDAELPMWMLFNVTGFDSGHLQNQGGSFQVAKCRNGRMYVGSDAGALQEVRFIEDHTWLYSTAMAWGGDSVTGIVHRNNLDYYQQGTGVGLPEIAGANVHDIAIYSRGDRRNIVYVATQTGLSRIDTKDYSVSDWNDLGNGFNIVKAVTVFDDHIYWACNTSEFPIYVLVQDADEPLIDSRYNDNDYQHFASASGVAWSSNLVNITYGGFSFGINGLCERVVGHDNGLTKLYPNYDNWGYSMIATITTTFNSGILHGDIRGAWLADIDTANLVSPDVDSDRSYKNNGLVTSGTVKRNLVATDSELVVYSGFAADNYLEQAYNSELDFGSGDFYVMGWFKLGVERNSKTIIAKSETTTSNDYLSVDTGVNELLRFRSGNTVLNATIPFRLNKWEFFTCTQIGGFLSIYINGELVGSGTTNLFLTSGAAILRVGRKVDATDAFNGTGTGLALIRLGGGVITEAQINEIHEQERPLFGEAAKCTLQGTNSIIVSAVDYDDVNDKVTACNGDTITKFTGLVASESSVETATSVSTVTNKELTGI